MKVTLSKDGTKKRTVDINEIEIPDMWHHIPYIRQCSDIPEQERNEMAEEILECWHLAHDLKRHIVEGK